MKNGFVVTFDKDVAMVELIVEQASYASYRVASFEIASVEHSWYDIEKPFRKGLKE